MNTKKRQSLYDYVKSRTPKKVVHVCEGDVTEMTQYPIKVLSPPESFTRKRSLYALPKRSLKYKPITPARRRIKKKIDEYIRYKKMQ